jgi:hypothetical protein
VSNKSRDPTTSKQFCNIDGLQRRTFSAVYTKVCSLRSVGQKSKRWSDQEDDITRKITKEQHEALTSLLNRRNNGGKTSTQLCNINGLQHRTVNTVYIRLCNLIPSDQGSNPLPSSLESNLPPSSQEVILPPSRQRINSWTDKENGIIRKLTEEQRKALGHIKRLTRGKSNSQLCNTNGLEHRTVTAVYCRFYALLPPAGPKNNWTDQELGNVYRLTVEQRKELIALKGSGRATILCSLPGLQSRTNNSVLGKWYDIHSDKNWTEEEANFVRHLTKKQLNKLEEVEKKNWAALAMEMCDINGLHHQTFSSVINRVQKELKEGRLENDQETFPAKDLPSRIYKKQYQLQNEQETSPAKDLRSSVYQSRPWTPEEDDILLRLTSRQRTALLSHKVITRSTISDFPVLQQAMELK